MSERKYTDEEIINALRHHADTTAQCESCLYANHQEDCSSRLVKDAFDLINRQKAEIESITKERDVMRDETDWLKKHYKKIMHEVVKDIFDKIGKILYKHTKIAIKKKNIASEITIDYIGEDIAELKEEYTKGADNNAR